LPTTGTTAFTFWQIARRRFTSASLITFTGGLGAQVWSGSLFCKEYKIDRLVYCESFDDVRNAIDREKRLKGWLRRKKIALIVSVNPSWSDLSEGWYGRHLYAPEIA
jgi:hypothetical protein